MVFLSVDNGNVYVSAYTSSSGAGSNDILLITVPSDGTGTGTYGDFTYAESSYSENIQVILILIHHYIIFESIQHHHCNDQNLLATLLILSTTNMASTNLTAENFIGISDGSPILTVKLLQFKLREQLMMLSLV